MGLDISHDAWSGSYSAFFRFRHALVRGALAYYEDLQTKNTKTAASSRATDARTREIELRIAERRRELISVERTLHFFVEPSIQAWASGSQKWKGTMADFTSRPVITSTKPTMAPPAALSLPPITPAPTTPRRPPLARCS